MPVCSQQWDQVAEALQEGDPLPTSASPRPSLLSLPGPSLGKSAPGLALHLGGGLRLLASVITERWGSLPPSLLWGDLASRRNPCRSAPACECSSADPC